MANASEFSPNPASFSVCLTVASINQCTGGTARSAPILARHLQRWSIMPCLFSSGELPSNYEGLDYYRNHAFVYPVIRNHFIHFLKTHPVDIVHDNGIWHPFNHMVAGVCKKFNIPRMVSSHGMLEPWSLQYKKWKKQIAWRLYQCRDLKTAACFHATADSEAENIRKLGLSQPIAVIPNGVDFPLHMPQKSQNASGIKKALFLSRIHPKKGLKDLIGAWSRVHSEKWELLIAGPDEAGHEAEIRSSVKKNNLSSKVHFLGNLSDHEKWRIYRSSDLFILPTYSENFGIVVAEALAAEVPVITTTGTPWKILEEEKCGWWIEPGEASLVSTLNEVLQLSSQELHAMGQRGREMVLRRYDWNMIARSMSDVYRWILLKGPKPECIF